MKINKFHEIKVGVFYKKQCTYNFSNCLYFQIRGVIVKKTSNRWYCENKRSGQLALTFLQPIRQSPIET